MSTATHTKQPRAVPAPPVQTPAPQPEQQPPERPSDAWLGDRVAMIVWLCAALTLAFLLLKDLAYALLFR